MNRDRAKRLDSTALLSATTALAVVAVVLLAIVGRPGRPGEVPSSSLQREPARHDDDAEIGAPMEDEEVAPIRVYLAGRSTTGVVDGLKLG